MSCVIVVNEDLGLSWDESWPRERIAKIREDYKRFVWMAPADLAKWRVSVVRNCPG